MNGNHDIMDLDLLYLDAKKIIDEVVTERIDGNILKNVNESISKLGESWRGQDALIQINKLIDVKNMLIDNREILGNIGVYISILAKNYREAQNVNGVVLAPLFELSYQKIMKSEKQHSSTSEIHMNNDILNIVTNLNVLLNDLNELTNVVADLQKSIFGNWVQENENRNYALEMMQKFSENLVVITKNVNELISNINTSIDNYNSSLNKVASMPSLASMFKENASDVKKEYSVEETQFLDSVKENFDAYKKINDNFNNAVINEVKGDLVSKGILQ